jgi:hypothetical protein
VVPADGISPSLRPYERRVLILNYAGLLALELTAGLAPASAAYRAAVLRLDEVSGLFVWSRWRESNPRSGLTKTVDCRYPTPAYLY